MNLKLYDGGSDKDELLISKTGNCTLFQVTSFRNQIFIMFTSDSNGVGKGFTAKFTFGNRITNDNDLYCVVCYLAIKHFLPSFHFYSCHR